MPLTAEHKEWLEETVGAWETEDGLRVDLHGRHRATEGVGGHW